MNSKLIFWSITVALGGFLFGMDTVVISGAEQKIQKLWQLSDWWHTTAIAMALYGTVFGAMFGGRPADKFGRKPTLIWIGILFFVSAIGAAIAPEVITFMVFRFIGGLCIGASSVVAPIYISEISPTQYRGRLVAFFQFNIVFGILIAFLCNYLLDGINDNDWRWMLAIVALPSILFSILMLFTPESPRWLLIHKGDEANARKILSITEPSVDKAIAEMKASAEADKNLPEEPFFSKKFSFPILLAFLIAFFNQVSGINAILYFAPRIFEMAGFVKESALLQSVGIGIVNLVFTIVGMLLIDRFGRKTLMYIGSIGYIISLGLTAWSFYTESFGNVIYYIFMFIASHAIGQGAVIWVFISEIFPNSVRAKGMSLGCFTHWIFAAIITQVFPIVATKYGGYPVFTFFCVMMVFQLLYVWRMMPETKGVSLEELQKRLTQ
jgi:MFS transporter, SP family, arabinose:H+ symporter